MTIRAILNSKHSEILSISASETVEQAVALMADRRIGALPVVEGDLVLGVFSERDVIYGLAREGAQFLNQPVSNAMITPVITVEPDESAIGALSLMTLRRIRHLPVIENGKQIGFVSIGDIVKYRIDRIESEAASLRDYIQSA